MQRGALLALPLLLVATGLTGCGLFDGSSTLDDALESMPGTVTRVTFFDRPATSDARLTTLDLEWEVTGYDAEGRFGRVWKVDDNQDLDDVVDDLVELGYERDDSGNARTLTIVPDENLVITGSLTSDVLNAVADDADSLIDTGAFEELIDSTDDVEVADLSRGDAVCSLGDSRVPPRQIAASGVADLASPEQAGFFVHGGDGDARAVMVFDDEGTADDEADAREAFLADGTSPISGVPYSEFGTADVEADGDQVRIDMDYDDPTDLSAVISRRDFPSVCVPG